MPRFVILRHDPGPNSTHPRHWDFMLEQGDILRTWALSDEPSVPDAIPARRLPDHRLAFLDYEGEVSGNRGHVARWDSGEYEIVSESNGGLVILLSGNLVRGTAELIPTETSPDSWRFQLTAAQATPSRGT